MRSRAAPRLINTGEIQGGACTYRDHVSQFRDLSVDVVDHMAEASALMTWCDASLRQTRSIPPHLQEQVKSRSALFLVRHKVIAGRGACALLLERYGPNGSVQPGLLEEWHRDAI